MVKNIYEINEIFKNISILENISNIKIEISHDNTTKLTCLEKKTYKHTFLIENDTLVIKKKKCKWFNIFNISFKKPQLLLSIPNSLNDISIKCNTGNVTIFQVKCNGNVDIKVNTGKLDLEELTCSNLKLNSNCGIIQANNVTVSNLFSSKSNTRKIMLKKCIANEFFIKTNTGKINGTLLTYNIFNAHTNTGTIKVDRPLSGCTFEAISKTGKIIYE